MIFDKELDFENAVIQRLVDAGWVNHLTNQPEILRYKTEKDLIQNWADILYEKNIHAWIDFWGYDVNHDWPWWEVMLKYFLPKMI